jgi:hypothetical protein
MCFLLGKNCVFIPQGTAFFIVTAVKASNLTVTSYVSLLISVIEFTFTKECGKYLKSKKPRRKKRRNEVRRSVGGG